jgi:hypothetical protein
MQKLSRSAFLMNKAIHSTRDFLTNSKYGHHRLPKLYILTYVCMYVGFYEQKRGEGFFMQNVVHRTDPKKIHLSGQKQGN